MPRLIDADALLDDIQEAEKNGGMGAIVAGTLKRFVKRTPTIDPESLRPQGRWGTIILNKENKTICIECAECGADFTIPLFDFGLCYHYCPNCGAKMDEEGEPE